MTGFGTRLQSALRERLPLCVGIDPHASLLDSWGLTQSADGLRTFALSCVDAFAADVAAVKPQSAFFERFGSQGIAVLEETIAAARAAGALVVLDAKRGDIGSTAEAYADAYLDASSPLFADALTVSPYLGFGSVTPMIERAHAADSGVFVLARTSNPEGAQVQAARDETGTTVGQRVIDLAAELNARSLATGESLGSVGVVVGATLAPGSVDLSGLNGPILAPGVGAQGAGREQLAALFADDLTVLPSSSREVLARGPRRDDLREIVASTAAAVAGR